MEVTGPPQSPVPQAHRPGSAQSPTNSFPASVSPPRSPTSPRRAVSPAASRSAQSPVQSHSLNALSVGGDGKGASGDVGERASSDLSGGQSGAGPGLASRPSSSFIPSASTYQLAPSPSINLPRPASFAGSSLSQSASTTSETSFLSITRSGSGYGPELVLPKRNHNNRTSQRPSPLSRDPSSNESVNFYFVFLHSPIPLNSTYPPPSE